MKILLLLALLVSCAKFKKAPSKERTPASAPSSFSEEFLEELENAP